jgi:hypothetical protein
VQWVSRGIGAARPSGEYVFCDKNNRFIYVRNKSIYPPQEKNPKGETHEDTGFFSYDKAVKKLMLRQFTSRLVNNSHWTA